MPRTPVQGRQIPANAASGLSFVQGEPDWRLARLGVLVFAEGGRGTRQRYCGLSHARQNGEATLLTLVTGWLPTFGGGGKPQRICSSSRSPSWIRTTGAIWSGKIARQGRQVAGVVPIDVEALRIIAWVVWTL